MGEDTRRYAGTQTGLDLVGGRGNPSTATKADTYISEQYTTLYWGRLLTTLYNRCHIFDILA
jgi:hypothetical protein